MRLRHLAVCSALVAVMLPRTAAGRAALADSTDLKVKNNSGEQALGAENSIFVHPTNPNIILEAHIDKSNGASIGWVSQDGGKSWSGNNGGFVGGASDPSAVIRRPLGAEPVRYFVAELSGEPIGVWAQYKDNPTELTWTASQLFEGSAGDKPHIWVDNKTTSPGAGYLYVAWSEGARVQAFRSTDNAGSWVPLDAIDAVGAPQEWGVNLKVGLSTSPDFRGHVYAVWGETVAQPKSRITGIHFNKSSNQGVGWLTSPTLVANLGSDGLIPRNQTELTGKTMGANSAPSMAVDASGNIYVVWGQKNAGTGSDGEIYLLKSAAPNEGSPGSWGSPVRVNQDPDDGQTDQWLPWITWDDCTGALAVVFFDSRDFLTKANTYVAVSYNEGATWSETKVSDVSWEGDVSPGGFAGDYIGIDARGGIAYPVWSDDRDTNDGTTFKVYTSPIYLWGIVQSSPTVTVSQSCPGRLRFDVQWDTTMPTDGLDRVEVYAPGVACSGSGYTSFAELAAPAGSHHQVIVWTGDNTCSIGWWNVRVQSRKCGGVNTLEPCKPVYVGSCVSCPPPCRPPCELE